MKQQLFIIAIVLNLLTQLFTPTLTSETMSQTAAKQILHLASQRGRADHGWLKSFHSFSFANYYNPKQMNFGLLRVLNDDRVEASNGFGKHPHANMEIVSIPLKGSLEHRDTMGNHGIIRAGDIQIMSAGSGIMHSEFEHSKVDPVEFLQIWVVPDSRDVKPRYGQITYDLKASRNNLVPLIAPLGTDASGATIWIHQKAWFSLGLFDADKSIEHKLNDPANGLYIFVIEGAFKIAVPSLSETILGRRDALGISQSSSVRIEATTAESQLLVIEVPLSTPGAPYFEDSDDD